MKWLKAVAFDAKGEKALDVQPVFADLNFSSVTDMKIGPDGGLYMWEYTSQLLSRLEYTGTCLPTVGIQARNALERTGLKPALLAGRRSLEVPDGFSGFALFDLEGKVKWSYRRGTGEGYAVADLPAGLADQVLLVKWEAAKAR